MLWAKQNYLKTDIYMYQIYTYTYTDIYREI